MPAIRKRPSSPTRAMRVRRIRLRPSIRGSPLPERSIGSRNTRWSPAGAPSTRATPVTLPRPAKSSSSSASVSRPGSVTTPSTRASGTVPPRMKALASSSAWASAQLQRPGRRPRVVEAEAAVGADLGVHRLEAGGVRDHLQRSELGEWAAHLAGQRGTARERHAGQDLDVDQREFGALAGCEAGQEGLDPVVADRVAGKEEASVGLAGRTRDDRAAAPRLVELRQPRRPVDLQLAEQHARAGDRPAALVADGPAHYDARIEREVQRREPGAVGREQREAVALRARAVRGPRDDLEAQRGDLAQIRREREAAFGVGAGRRAARLLVQREGGRAQFDEQDLGVGGRAAVGVDHPAGQRRQRRELQHRRLGGVELDALLDAVAAGRGRDQRATAQVGGQPHAEAAVGIADGLEHRLRHVELARVRANTTAAPAMLVRSGWTTRPRNSRLRATAA